jgi:PTH1 family peptidyl-tRNA hydrolase
MNAEFKLIVGLGNPGRSYAATRHNVGFWWLDALARRLNLNFAPEPKFSCDMARLGDIRFIKPTTFMNRSGVATAGVARFFNIAPEQILVAHDELDLTPGQLRVKKGGGSAGHNGLRDITAKLGTADFWRLRFGIGHPRHTDTPLQPVVDYVLKPPSDAQQRLLDDALDRAAAAWSFVAAGNVDALMLKLHTDPAH